MRPLLFICLFIYFYLLIVKTELDQCVKSHLQPLIAFLLYHLTFSPFLVVLVNWNLDPKIGVLVSLCCVTTATESN